MNESAQLALFMKDADNDDIIMKPNNVTVSKLLSDKNAFFINVALAVVSTTLISVFGIVANIINIIVFIKQGAYKECGIVNLLGLAVSDLFVAFTMLYYSVFGDVLTLINPPNLPWEVFDFVYLTGGWPHLMFAQITRGITAYIAFERCVCVVLPFKVRTMLSPRRSILIIVCVFVCFVVGFVPPFISFGLRYKVNPVTNVSRLVLVKTLPESQAIVDILWYINSIAFNIGSVAVVFVCTVITVSRVNLSKEWRSSMASGNTSESNAEQMNGTKSTKPSTAPVMGSSRLQKEKKLIKMMVSISTIFLLCYLPDFAYLLVFTIEKDIHPLGKYSNLAMMMYTVIFMMETFNSSINIVVYYKMSSRYKEILRKMFGLSKENQP